jgi:hypothetical protein
MNLLLRDSYKTLSAAILIFGCDFVKLARQDFQRNSITPQVFSLVFLVSPKNLKFRHETVL